uniref:YceI family protein n=1 Tax=Ningiella ruwaisensis TaxID=2364274 RepID=UPI00109F4BC8|nr:YceI family protein [Ningiella ruwaisensis]
MHYLRFFALACLLCASTFVFSKSNIDNTQGIVGFAGEHAGMAFSGEFTRWNAKISLPPEASPSIEAEFQLASARTGDAIYDETLPEGDWFDVKNHPVGKFTSSNIEAVDNGYLVEGTLRLRGKTLPVSFKLNENGERLQSRFAIDRLEYGIGLDSDPEADWVSREIQMTLDIPKP